MTPLFAAKSRYMKTEPYAAQIGALSVLTFALSRVLGRDFFDRFLSP